jgi:hypothetical protein
LPAWQARDLQTTRVGNAIGRQLPGRIVGIEVRITSSGDLMSGEYDVFDEPTPLIERIGG